MAHIYKRPRSPFWWINWRNPSTGQIERFATPFRIGLDTEKRKAKQALTAYQLKELACHSNANKAQFDNWVPDFLLAHYQNQKSYQRTNGAWRVIREYLDSLDVHFPTQVDRQLCINYIPWRKKLGHLMTEPVMVNGKPERKKKTHHNTALMELKVLGMVMEEARVREYCPTNPCVRLKIGKIPAREKGEFNDAQIAIVREMIAIKAGRAENQEQFENAHFLRVSFEIALAQACRMKETLIALDDVNLENLTIRTVGKGKDEIVNLNPALVPLFEELKAQGRTHTFIWPRMQGGGGLVWYRIFDEIRRKHPGFANLSFHSTRVTGISRAGRAGVPEAVTMAQVMHASTTVHRIYRRVRPEEMNGFWRALPAPAPVESVLGAAQAVPSEDKPAAPETPGVPSATAKPKARRSAIRR